MESLNIADQKIFNRIKSDASVNDAIQAGAAETPENDWTVMDICDVAYDSLELELDTSNTDLFKVLLQYFNGEQAARVAELQG